MSVMRTGLIGVMIAALSAQSGCSFLFVSGPPADHANMATFECSESNAVPVLDTIWATLNGIGAISAAGDNTNPNQGEIVAVGLSWLALSGAAAIYGYTKVSQCKAARRERDERYANGGAPPAYRPAPMPAPAGAPPPAPAPMAAQPAATTTIAPPAAAPTAKPASPTSSLAPSRAVRPAARSPLAMRSASAVQ